MKNTFIALLCFCSVIYSFAQPPKREVRATWIASVSRIDWPKSTNSEVQKKELITIFDKLQAANMNTAYLQVRPMCDAFYNSAYEPWSQYLTGTRGKDPGYDPLAFAIEEAHKRGLELHAWLNPYRYESGSVNHGNDDKIRKEHPEWLLNYTDADRNIRILDPGNPEATAYITNVVKDIVSKYDIDGVIFDDYFYPYGGTDNQDSYSQDRYKPAGKSIGDWRRENINTLVAGIYQMIQTTKPTVKFGIGPFGIWGGTQAAADANGIKYFNAGGTPAYSSIYCDGVAWLKQKSIDYISPQCYWPTTEARGYGYKTLVPWWSEVAEMLGRHFYSSMRIGTMSPVTTECGIEIDINRANAPENTAGHVLFNTTQFFSNGLDKYVKTNKFTKAALTPIFTWKEQSILPPITNVEFEENTLRWNAESNNYNRFAIYLVPNNEINNGASFEKSDYLEKITWEKSIDISSFSTKLPNYRFAISVVDANGYESQPYITPTATDFDNHSFSGLNIWGGVQAINITSSKENTVRIYSVTGQLIRVCPIPEGETTIEISSGMYIVNGIKVIVR